MKANPRKISSHRSYTIKELADTLAIDEKTCFRWIEQGLRTIPGCKKPLLIYGYEAKEFMKNRKLKKKISLNRSQFLCLTCKVARFAKRGTIKVVGNKKTAVCRVCNGRMSRII
jgi:transposase-like protein